MALADFEDNYDDPYRTRAWDALKQDGGIAGPQDGLPTPPPAPKGGYDLEAFRKRWTQSGNVNDPNAWLQGNQDITSGVTLKNEKAYDPSGRFIADLVGNYSGGDPSQRSRIFLDGIGSNGQPRAASGMGAKGAAGAKGGTPAPAPAANPFLTQIRQLIMSRMGQMQQTPSLDDPTLAAQNQSYARSRDRGAEQERAAMAERAAAQGQLMGGQSSGSFDTELRSILEGAGEDKAAFGAQLLGDENQARRAELNSLMNMALQSGDAESARALSLELAKMDDATRRLGLSQQNAQFNADLGYRNRTFDDTYGRLLGRDYEDDYRYRVNLGLGVL